VPFILAQTSTTPPPPSGIWYPTILGILVVAAAVGLFCGSIYLLLGTNLGARLGFLIAFTALAGFMVLLTTMWLFTASPLNTLKGTTPAWSVKKVVHTLDDPSLPPEIQHVKKDGTKVPTQPAQVLKAAADARLVIATPVPNIPLAPTANQFAQFSAATDYTETNYYEVGGSTPMLLSWQASHSKLYAVVQYCAVVPVNQPFGLPPPTPVCDTSSPKNGFVIMEYNYGSLRFPPFVALVCSSILFVLGLLALHWREKDERAAEKAKQQAAGEIGPAGRAEERVPEPVG
jgi:hypothetical protein